jgi:glycosyltransferase involved in cell wall biosynthesis
MDAKKRPKVIVVAVACAPFGGSEGRIGWEGVLAISTFARVRVLTAGHNRPDWERARSEGLVPEGIAVDFLGTDRPWNSNRLIARIQSWWRYLGFLKKARWLVDRLIQDERPDVIHHLTYGSWRVPSPLWGLKTPLVWGPVGGAGEIPRPFLSSLSPSARLFELVRSIQSFLVLRSRNFKSAVRNADFILTADRETASLLTPYRQGRPMRNLPIAYLAPDKIAKLKRARGNRSPNSRRLTLFAGGNIEGRKGISWALQALRRVKQSGVEFEYTIAGGGPDVPRLKELATKLELREAIIFHPGYRGDEYDRVLGNTDIFLLPSFRESLGMTCQEAIVAGALPVVADIGAQGWLVSIAGFKGASVKSEQDLVADLTQLILDFKNRTDQTQERVKEGAQKVSEFFSEENYITTLREVYRIVQKNH